MRLTVRLFAALRERAGCDRLELDGLPDGLTVAGLKREVERRVPALGSLDHVAGVVGTTWADDARALQPGDDVALLPPVSGGAPGEDERLAAGVFELCAEPLESARASERVAADGCGAIVVFTGATRDANRGQRVVRLEYEAFEAMTGPEMERIFARARALLQPGETARMLVQHRIGTVLVGQPSVVVAVASPHRDAAFRLARCLIDELKRTLPVWKKEVYRDGHHWIGDRS